MIRKYPQLKQVASWPILQPGDIIDVVAPASACKRSELNAAVRYLKNQGYRPRVARDIFMKGPKLFAQSDAERLAQLQRALQAKDSKVIWCVRGGYGAIRLMPSLMKMRRPATPKILVGYSDVTTLHGFLNTFWRWPTLHGPLLDRFGRKANLPQETRELLGLLTGGLNEVRFSGLKAMNAPARKTRRIQGAMVGGNLTVLHSSLATKHQAQPNGSIVFFEDLGERPHRVDRMLTQLTQAGYFKGAKAIVFGDMLLSDARDRRLLWKDVLQRFADSSKCPVLRGLPCGHGRVQRPLPLMSRATLTTGPRAGLVVMAPR